MRRQFRPSHGQVYVPFSVENNAGRGWLGKVPDLSTALAAPSLGNVSGLPINSRAQSFEVKGFDKIVDRLQAQLALGKPPSLIGTPVSRKSLGRVP